MARASAGRQECLPAWRSHCPGVYCSQPAGFVDSSCPDMVSAQQFSLWPQGGPPGVEPPVCCFSTDPGVCGGKVRYFSVHLSPWRETAYLLLYVDDIILTASSESLLCRIIASLQQEFAMKDLGALHHFLGVEPHPAGLLLHQRQYTLDILERAGMTDCKPCSTLVDTQGKLSEAGGTPVTNPTAYQSCRCTSVPHIHPARHHICSSADMSTYA